MLDHGKKGGNSGETRSWNPQEILPQETFPQNNFQFRFFKKEKILSGRINNSLLLPLLLANNNRVQERRREIFLKDDPSPALTPRIIIFFFLLFRAGKTRASAAALINYVRGEARKPFPSSAALCKSVINGPRPNSVTPNISFSPKFCWEFEVFAVGSENVISPPPRRGDDNDSFSSSLGRWWNGDIPLLLLRGFFLTDRGRRFSRKKRKWKIIRKDASGFFEIESGGHLQNCRSVLIPSHPWD